MEAEKQEKTDNELIAQFLRVPISHSLGVIWVVDKEGEMPDYKNGTVFYPSNDWNQLMIAVDNIEELGYDVTIFHDEDGHQCIIWKAGHSYTRSAEDMVIPNVPVDSGVTKIKAVCTAVVNFIKWHTSQKPLPL